MAEADVSSAIGRADAEKDRGNACLERGRVVGFQHSAGRDALKLAGKHYYEALAELDGVKAAASASEELEQRWWQMLNLALLSLEIGSHGAVAKCCQDILAREPGHPKALYRLALSKEACHELEEAKELVGRAHAARPGSKAITQAYERIRRRAEPAQPSTARSGEDGAHRLEQLAAAHLGASPLARQFRLGSVLVWSDSPDASSLLLACPPGCKARCELSASRLTLSVDSDAGPHEWSAAWQGAVDARESWWQLHGDDGAVEVVAVKKRGGEEVEGDSAWDAPFEERAWADLQANGLPWAPECGGEVVALGTASDERERSARQMQEQHRQEIATTVDTMKRDPKRAQLLSALQREFPNVPMHTR